MKDAAKHLLDAHKGKTVTISVSTIFALLYAGAQYEVIPVPATQAYVQTQIEQHTKGLNYLVKQGYERDLDTMYYDVYCMNRRNQEGAFQRLEAEYQRVVREQYQRKPCDELERRFASQEIR